MPPQIKQDLNRSGWETTDFPSVCENCLPENPFVQMLKEDHGAECKICTRPFTVFQWKPDRTSRPKKTTICLTCARLKNCCQCCMLDLSFGLPIFVRDAALKMIAPGPQSAVNREFYAQEHEKEIEEGRGAVQEYEKTDEKARELLKRLANSQPYFKKQRRIENTEGEGENAGASSTALARGGAGPIRTRETRGGGGFSGGGVSRGSGRGGRGGARGGRPSAADLPPPGPQDILPPKDRSIATLLLTGITDDLPEYEIRNYFEDPQKKYGKLRSLVCSHMCRCAMVNFFTREAAERAAKEMHGRVVIANCPLRVRWAIPQPIGKMGKDERYVNGQEGRKVFASSGRSAIEGGSGNGMQKSGQAQVQASIASMSAVAPPPGAADVQYASLAGN